MTFNDRDGTMERSEENNKDGAAAVTVRGLTTRPTGMPLARSLGSTGDARNLAKKVAAGREGPLPLPLFSEKPIRCGEQQKKGKFLPRFREALWHMS